MPTDLVILGTGELASTWAPPVDVRTLVTIPEKKTKGIHVEGPTIPDVGR